MTLAYREWAPIPPLAGLIEAIWSLTGQAGGAGPHRILPDGCSELILNFGDPVVQLEEAGPVLRQPPILFMGQLAGPLFIRPTGQIDQLGIRFRPAGAAGFLREPQSRLLGAALPLGDLAPRLAGALARRPFDTADPLARVLRVQECLGASVIAPPTLVGSVADRLVGSWGAIPLDQLARDAGWSRRRLERRFQAEVGLRPKLLARICRFQRVFRALEDDSARWARVAADCGYYDASHLIRDFRELAGEAPSRLLEATPVLTRLFTRARRAADYAG